MAGRGRADRQLVEQLKKVPLFSGCSARELASLGRFLREVDFPAGRQIVQEGRTGTGLHVIVEGETRVEVTTGFGSSTLITLVMVSHPPGLHTSRETILSPGVEKVTAGAGCVDVPPQAAGVSDRIDNVSSPARLGLDRRPCTAAFEACGIGSSLICDQAIDFHLRGQATVWFPPSAPQSDPPVR